MVRFALCGLFAALASLPFFEPAHSAAYKVLHKFDHAADGAEPLAGLIMDKNHTLYGTTASGGPGQGGTVFSLTRAGVFTVLHAFGNDGGSTGSLTSDQMGNLYGVTQGGDMAFKLAPDGTETVLHSFGSGTDGDVPVSGLTIDKRGNLYGATLQGGTDGCGTVFQITSSGTESVLYDFACDFDGPNPLSSLLLKSGNVYGTTSSGGGAFAGNVFRLSRRGLETVLYSFSGGDDGKLPEYGAPIMDQAGNIYGAASQGGASRCGTVYRISPDGTFTVLHAFTLTDGCNPDGGLLADVAGNLYGTTKFGGAADWGAVFKLAADGTETVLHSFTGTNGDGAEPLSTLIADGKGNLYGTTVSGGRDNGGTIFKIKE